MWVYTKSLFIPFFLLLSRCNNVHKLDPVHHTSYLFVILIAHCTIENFIFIAVMREFCWSWYQHDLKIIIHSFLIVEIWSEKRSETFSKLHGGGLKQWISTLTLHDTSLCFLIRLCIPLVVWGKLLLFNMQTLRRILMRDCVIDILLIIKNCASLYTCLSLS